MTTVGDIYDAIDAFAPFGKARPSDNCGITLGSRSLPVHRALAVVDVTREIVREAARRGADLIISHHPAIYAPIKSIAAEDPVFEAARNGIALLAAHTNLDVADGGVNDAYLAAIGLEKLAPVEGTDGCAALARCPEALSELSALAARVKACVGLPCVKLVDAGRKIKTAAVCCGGGASFFECAVKSGADVFISGDFRHNHAVDALRLGVSLIDAGHYETERLILDPLIDRLGRLFPDVPFERAAADRPVFQYVV